MTREQITGTLQKLADLREKQARANASTARVELARAQEEVRELVAQRQRDEANIRDHETCTGSDLFLLEVSREQFKRRLDTATERAEDAQTNLDDARLHHADTLGNRRTAVKVHDHVRRQRNVDLDRKLTRNLEELSRSHWLATSPKR